MIIRKGFYVLVHQHSMLFQDDSCDSSSVGVSNDPAKDKKYLEEAVDTLRVQKNEV